MKVHFTTLGCPKNQVDSELMLGMLSRAGHQIVEAAEAADCLVVNTCAFIDRAREESVNTILQLAQLKERGRARALIVTGCLTQRYGGEIRTEIPEINAILGTSELHRIVDLVNQADGRQAWVSEAPPGYLYDAQTPRLLTGRVPYAYVKIAEGCDMGCTFCAIPQFRGRHRSRPLTDKWRRARVVPYLDMPVQHGDDSILKAMRRGVTARRMLDVIARLRDAVPGVTMRTTVLVGFPGETEAAFQNLLGFVEDAGFDRLGVFTYSVEEGTPAAAMPDQVPPEVMAERAQQVQ